MPLQIRRGTEAERLAMSVPLAPGELLYVTDDERLFIGNGISIGENLVPVTGYTNEDAQDAAAALILSGNHNNIVWNYNDVGDSLSSTVNLSEYVGEISADGFRGNLIGDDSTILVKALNSSVNLDGTVKGNVIPDFTEVYNIGSAQRRFRDLHLSANGLYIGEAQISATGSFINLPAGSLINGEPIRTEADVEEGIFLGELTGSVFGNDSSLIIDGLSNSGFFDQLTTESLLFNGTSLLFNNDRINIQDSIDGNSYTVRFVKLSPNGAFTDVVIANSQGLLNSGRVVNSYTGSPNVPTVLGLGDAISIDLAAGYKGVGLLDENNNYSPSTFIRSRIDPNGAAPDSDSSPGRIDLYTIDDGNFLNGKGLSIDSRGFVAINQGESQAQATLDINGFVKLSILSIAPANPTNGMIAIADGDASLGWDPLALGVPTKQQMVVYLGGAWVAISQES